MADQTPPERPRPAYGEYATPEEVAALTNRPVPPAPAAPPPPPVSAVEVMPVVGVPVRVPLADRMLTGLLLGFGFVVTLTVSTSAFGLEQGFQDLYDQYGLGPYTPTFPVTLVATLLIVSHVGLFIIALVGTVRRTRAGKRGWWVALAAGIVAAAVFWTTMFVLIATDAKLMEALKVAAAAYGNP